MRIIAIEEHVGIPEVTAASAGVSREVTPHLAAAYDIATGWPYCTTPDVLGDLGERRLATMDAHGITMQVLSTVTTQQLPATVAPALVRDANDVLADAVRRHPDRFAAFASLPTTAPEHAPAELRRCVEELGFVGTMVMGRSDGDFLSAARFAPVLATAARLGVPLYLHPGVPNRVTAADNYEAGLPPLVAARFATAAWGWHNDAGIHFLHLVLSGVLDRHPELQIVLGHWGEMVPWFVDRLDEALPRSATGLERTIGDYLRQNAYCTPSGMFSPSHLRFCLEVFGVERIIHSVDHPFLDGSGSLDFLRGSGLTDAQQRAIAHGNAERLLRLR